MKIIIFIITAFLSTAIANAQWQRQTIDTKASLRGLSVVNEKIIWASGTGGTFLRTIDGGQNWTVGKVPEADKLDFRDVEAFDANTAYLLSIGNGETSRIYKTTDGGKTWQMQYKANDEKIFLDAFAFWDKDHGIAMGDPVNGYFYLLRTDDGGQKWYQLPTNKMSPAKEGEAAFAASGTCLITHGKNNVFLVSGGREARVFRSNDRGNTWLAAETPFVKGTDGSGIFSIAMFDAMKGVIVGGDYQKPNEANNNLAFTKDGGKTWTPGKGLNGYRSGVAYLDKYQAVGVSSAGTDIWTIKNLVIAVGSGGSDLSKDGGKTWTNLDKENYNAVQAKGNAVWVVGANGLVSRFVNKYTQ
jgi:photosystem II stability/assembly factor-like uncharacterized protein